MKTHLRAACGFAFLAALSTASSEPTPLVRRLMDEGVSLFSFALFRLDLEMDRAAKDTGFAFGSAKYIWDANEIELSATWLGEAPKECAAGPKACEDKLKALLGSFSALFDFRTKEGVWMEFITSRFTPIGYDHKNLYQGKSSEKAVPELGAIVRIKGELFSAGRIVTCKRSLKSADYYCLTK